MKPIALATALFSVAALLCASPRAAAAQSRTAGDFTIAGMVATTPTPGRTTGTPPVTSAPSTDFGGAMVADLWANFGPLRVGGTMGVSPVTSGDATRSRVILPMGASVALSLHTDVHFAFDLRLRGGVWAGATNFGIAADLWGSLGLWLGYDVGAKATAYVGLDVWLVRAQVSQDERDPNKKGYDVLFFVGPGLSISWLP